MPLDKFELLDLTFLGENNEELPVSFWKHFPEYDKTVEGLVKSHTNWLNKFNFDFLKFSPHGRFSVVDFGCRVGPYDPETGSRSCRECRIKRLDDWEEIAAVDGTDGEFGKQLKALEKTARIIGNKTPIFMTVFSPFMTASKMDPRIINHIQQNGELIYEGLKEIYATTLDYTEAALEQGAMGIFLATQHFSTQTLDSQALKRFEYDFLKKLLLSISRKAQYVILHLHGSNPAFEYALKLLFETRIKKAGINWHDRTTSPSMAEAAKKFAGGLIGGVDGSILKNNNKDEIEMHLNELFTENFPRNQVIIAGGCVLPLSVTDEAIKSALSIAKNYKIS